MPKHRESQEIFSNKMDFMAAVELQTERRFTDAESWLFDKIIQQVLPELDVEDGQIKNTNRNIRTLTRRMNVVMQSLRTGKNAEIVDRVLHNMGRISTFNKSYFGIVSDVAAERFDNATSRVEAIMRRALGFTPDGKIRPKSFIDSISQVDGINNTLREYAIKSIQGGSSVETFTAQLDEAIRTDQEGLGILNRNRKQLINDRYAQYDRAESKSFADEFKMQAFIFSGGKVSDTRRFCCQRNGIVFTREEARRWATMKWTGKNRGYSPLIDMGGYNCRHSPQWISNRVAMRRRDDLFINDEGKLVSNNNRRQPPLNNCS